MTGRVDILCPILENVAKQFKSQDPKKDNFLTFLELLTENEGFSGPVTSY